MATDDGQIRALVALQTLTDLKDQLDALHFPPDEMGRTRSVAAPLQQLFAVAEGSIRLFGALAAEAVQDGDPRVWDAPVPDPKPRGPWALPSEGWTLYHCSGCPAMLNATGHVHSWVDIDAGRPAPPPEPKLHSERCRCDGLGIVPGPAGHAVGCPETLPS